MLVVVGLAAVGLAADGLAVLAEPAMGLFC